MHKKRTLQIIAAVLMAEAILIAFLPSQVPRAGRAITAAVDAAAAAGLWLLAGQRRGD